MTNRSMRAIGVLMTTAMFVAATAGVSLAQQRRFLGRDDVRLYGIGLRVEPAHQTVPRDIATIVSTFLQAPAMPDGLPPFAPDAVVRATLRGPGLAAPRELSVAPNTPFEIPPLTVAGLYSLDNIRLESGGAVLLRGAPESVTIEVIERLLVTQVTARALSAAEIREKGIVFDQSNFQAYNFSAAFAIEERKVELSFPVLLPQVQGASDVATSVADVAAIAAPSLPTLQTIIPDTLKLQTQIPNLSVVGFTLKVPNIKGEEFLVPPIPGVIVIPGDIGFLNQFFSVMLMVGNVAPAGSNLVVDNLSAEIVLPPGYDEVVGSADDPLAMARTAQGETPRIRVIVQPGPDGALGTPDDIGSIGPGESGSAEYLVEGRREGSHVVEMAISGTLHGLPIGPVAVQGRAAGAVLVRNPAFTLTFTHPEAVAAGEPYTLDVTVSNTSESPANFVSVSLYPRNVSGATIVGEPTRSIESIPPGDSATISFDLISRITGKVTAATLDSNENVAGRFALKAAVGELGVPVSPDSLVLPKEAAALPSALRQAAIGLLGKAWAVATAPAAALPPGIQRFSKKVVIDRAIEVAAAGFRVTLHEPAPDSAAQLLMDFAGSQWERLPQLNPQPADLTFAQTNVRGFDALRRTSIRGDTFAATVGAMLAPSLQASGPADFHLSLSEKWSYRPQFISLLVSGNGSLPMVTITDAQGRRLGGTDEGGKIVKQIPFSDVVPISDAAGTAVAQLLLIAAPESGEFAIALQPADGTVDAPATISLVVPGGNGTLRHAVYDLAAGELPLFVPQPDDPFRLTFTGEGAPRPVDRTSPIADPAPAIVGALQLPSADQLQCSPDSVALPVGRVIAVLFSEEVTAASVQDKVQASLITNYAVGGNKVVGVALQPGGRIAFIALRDPIGIYIPRELQMTGIMDLRGNAMPAGSVPIEAVLDRGGVVSGQVLQADGTPVPFADVRLFYLMACEEPAWVGISAKTADSQGRYSFDFVSADLRDRIVVVNPDDARDFRSVPFTIARAGQRLNVDVVFLGRGTIAGRTLNEAGQPLANTSLRVTSLTDQSQYGVTTDAQGRFSVARVPVGNIFIEAVNTTNPATLRASDYIPFAGATVTRDLILIDEVVRETTIQHGALRGYILRADGATPARDVPVVVYYEHFSQTGVRCPGNPPPGECAVAMMNTDANGAFAFDEVTAGRLRVYAFDQGALAEGEVRFTLAANGQREFAVLLNGGLATVTGVVLDPSGQPVAGVRVGGGLSLSTTNAAGQFTLADVPIGRRQIVAVSDALQSRGTATIDIVRTGEAVNVTIVLGAVGSIAGVVYQADGVTPIANQPVYAFKNTTGDEGAGIQVVGTAITNATGGYRIDGVGVGEYFVSAVNESLSDGNVLPAKLRFNQQVFRADIRFRGAGTVRGVVLDDDGQTPMRGLVGISGQQLVVADNRVAVEFRHVQYYAVAESDLATGRFSFPGVWVGDFTLTAAGAFSPDPITFDGVVPAAGAVVDVNLQLQATSQVAGIVHRPDGVTPVGSGVIVRYKSDAFRVICREDAFGDSECESIPQGIQEETVITGDDGRFWLPIVNAGEFTITVEDVATGRVGEAKGSVRAGERAEMNVRLTGLGDLTVRVTGSDGVTPIPGARVRAEQVEHPKKVATFLADALGLVQFAGGDAFSEGTVILTATDLRNGFTGRASARIEQDGQQVTLNVAIFDATGSVRGTLYRSDGLTPVVNGEIVISKQGMPLALVLTDAEGRYESPGIPLGAFDVEAFEAATSRRAVGSGTIDFANQDVPVNLTQLAVGLVKGTVLLGGPLTPLKGWSVGLAQPSLGGISRPSLLATSGVDGTYRFPGVTRGEFNVRAYGLSAGHAGTAAGSGTLVREGQVVDMPLVANVVRPLYGRVQGEVLTPSGEAAAFTDVQLCQGLFCLPAITDADGTFAFDEVRIGRWIVAARSQVSASTGATPVELLFDDDVVDVRVVLAGVASLSGVVEHNNGTPAANVELRLDGDPNVTCAGQPCTRFADSSGAFTFADIAAQRFTITALDPITGLRGSVGGQLLAGESRAVRIVLQPTAQVSGRVFKANGSAAAGVTVEIKWSQPDERALFLATDSEGRFSFAAVPLVAYELTIEDPIGPGTARRSGQLAGSIVLADIILDEAPPQIDTIVPAPSATGVALDALVRLTFTEPILPATLTASSVTLEGPDGLLTTVLDVVDGDRVVTLRPLNPLRDETQYTVRVRPTVQDRLGKQMVSEYVASFRTADITAPRWLEISPAPNTGGVSIHSPIRIPFSEPIAPSAFSAPFELRDAGGAAVAGRVDVILGNTVLVFTPNLPLLEDAAYHVRLGTAEDLAGNRQATGLDFTITTTDRTPPQIASLVGPAGGSVIENDVARVSANVGATHDVGVVDFYINDALAFADRTPPFELAFQAVAAYGAPGSSVRISAIATDTSGNRGSPAAIDVPIVADQPAAVAITAPAADLQVANGARVTVSVRVTDDLGVTRVGFRAATGLPQDASSRTVSPSCLDCVEQFAFNVPADAPPGTRIALEASAIDTYGHTSTAAPVSITVVDAVAPTVTITGATTGARVMPGQSATAVVTAQDPGAIASITFTVAGAASLDETRTVTPPQNSVVTSFTFRVPANAQPGQSVTLDAVAVDRAGNIGVANRVILPVADRNRPTLTLRTADGLAVAVPGQSVSVVASAEDEIGVTRIELNGQGSFVYSDARQVSPPSGSALVTFDVPVPSTAAAGSVLTLQGRAFDLSGNVSLVATLNLTVTSLPELTLPESVIVIAGETQVVTLGVPGGAPAGLRVDLSSTNTAIATVTPFVNFAAGETSRSIEVTGVGTGTASVAARILGAERASMTVTVRGGIVRGRVFDAQLNPVPGVELTISGGGLPQATVSDASGDFMVEGITGPEVTVRALDPVSQHRGYAAGTMSRPNGAIDLNVVLVPAGRISGSVLIHDGITPTGDGARVEIFELRDRQTPLAVTFTAADGSYEFPLVSVGAYVLRATDLSGNIGEASAAIAATGEDRTANIVYLGRGRVTINVLDGAGASIANAPLTFNVSTVFGWGIPLEVVADANGGYTFENVPVGTFSATGRDPVTNRAGTASGQITQHGDALTLTITVASYGSVQGTVYRSDGVTPVVGAHVVANGAQAVTTDSEGHFSFAVLPLGFVQLTATESATNGLGSVSTSISTNGQVRTADIVFAPQGTLIVTVTDAGGAPVADVGVTAQSGSPQKLVTSHGRTDAQGVAVLPHVQAGSFVVHASSGSRSGTTSGTLNAGETQPVTVQLMPTASIAGMLFEPDGATPARGRVDVLFVSNDVHYWAGSATVGVDGVYRIDGLLLSGDPATRVYSLIAYDQANNQRARHSGVMLTENGEVHPVNLTFVGLGTVHGRVLNPDSSSAGAMQVQVRSLHPTFGRLVFVTTDAAGYWEVRNLPVGPFSVRAGDVSRGLLGDAFGILSAHGQDVGADIVLQLNAVNMPQNRFDANGMAFDLHADGSIGHGTNAAFADTQTALQRGGALLEVIGDAALAFEGSAIGTLEDGGREVAVRQTDLAGLNVTRKVYVPSDGYFARYLETLSNPTDQPITVDLRVYSRVRGSSIQTCNIFGCGWLLRSAAIHGTSSGDLFLNVANPATADRWVVLDDATNSDPFINWQNNAPSLAFVFDGVAAATRVSEASFATGDPGLMQWRWNGITVPAGGTVSLMHFVVQQLTRAASLASASRLGALPPEALDGLSPEEVATIVNFAVPADGVGTVPPLVALSGTVTGRVLEGDGTTPSASALVNFQSANVLFGRVHPVIAGLDGRFSFESSFSDFGTPRVIPVDAYVVSAQHAVTQTPSGQVAGTFGEAALSATSDIVLPTGLASGTVRRHNGIVVTSGSVSITGLFTGGVSLNSDGTFQFRGLRAGSYTFTTTLSNPFGTGVHGSATATITVGQNADASITLEATGTVAGVVRLGSGLPAVNRLVRLVRGGFERNMNTDSGGVFRFDDVPLGSYQIWVIEPQTFVQTTVLVTVNADETANVVVNLVGVGSARVTVTRPSGAVMPGARVHLTHDHDGARILTLFTGADGSATFPAVPVGPFTLRVDHPALFSLATSASGSVSAVGQQADVAVVLPAVSAVTGTVRLPSGAVAPDITVLLTTTNPLLTGGISASTDANGVYRFTAVPVGAFNLLVQNTSQGVFGTASGQVATDDETITVNIDLITNLVTLPRNLFDGNGFRYDVQSSGLLLDGSGDAYDGGLSLRLFSGVSNSLWAGSGTGLLEDGGREIAIQPQAASTFGLDVRRKVYVPADGYMVRYLEVLSNATASPITVDLQVQNFLGSDSATRIVGTSSGDLTFAADDHWVVTDDENGSQPYPDSDPSLAHVIGGPASVMSASIASLASDQMTYRWSNITVPAGGRAIVMHFAAQHFSGPQAMAVAQRLVQLPPEALAGLAPDEIRDIVNFNVPLDGSSTLPPAVAPPLGTITGTITAHDGTPISGSVTFTNSDLLFGRRVTQFVNVTGAFSVTVSASEFTAQAFRNSLQSPVVTGTFAPGSTTAAITVPFSNTGGVRGVVRRSNGSPVIGSNSFIDIEGHTGAFLDATGAYSVVMQTPGPHTVNAFTPAPGGGGYLRGTAVVEVVAGQTAVADVIIEATGRITGVVRRPNGAPVGAAVVTLAESSFAFFRETIADANGAFVFEDARVGESAVSAYEPESGASALVNVTVAADTTHAVELTMSPTGRISGVVRNPDGTPAVTAAVSIFGNVNFRTVYTDSFGAYEFPNIAAGCCFTIRAGAPGLDNTVYREVTGNISEDGEALTFDFVLPPRVTLHVGVVDSTGAPLVGAQIYINNVWHGSTDGEGYVDIPNVWQTPYTIRADFWSIGTVGFASGTLTDADHGRIIDVLIEPPRAGIIEGTLFAADGMTRVPGYVNILDVSSNSYLYSQYTETGDFEASVAVNSGGYRVEAFPNASYVDSDIIEGNFSAAGQRVRHDFAFDISVVRGTVRYQDGTPVQYPSVFARGLTPSGSTEMFYATQTNVDGSYLMLNLGVGPFSLLAQDNMGLVGTADSAVVDRMVPVDLDVMMSPTGTVTGVVRDAGVRVPDVYLDLIPDNPLAPRRWAQTDSSGAFTITPVSAGTFTIRACIDQRCSATPGEISYQDETVHLTVTMPPPAFVNGVVYSIDGVTPASNVWVRAYTDAHQQFSTFTDDQGRFNFDNLPHANLRLYAVDDIFGASASVSVLAGRTADVTLWLGTAWTTNAMLTGADQFWYGFDCTGRMENSGHPDTTASGYDGTYRLSLDGWSVRCPPVIAYEDSNREAVIGPWPASSEGADFEFTRKIYVPESGRFARYLEIVRNTTNAARTVAVRLDGGLYGSQVAFTPQSTGNRYAVTTGGQQETLTIGHVFAGEGGQAPSTAAFFDDFGGVHYEWLIHVGPGQSVALLHYTAQRHWDDVEGARAQAAALSTLSDPEALAGLTPEELGMIVNFRPDGGVTPPTGSVGGQTLDVDGLPLRGMFVYAIDGSTGRILATTVTTESGHYRFDNLSSMAGIQLLALHPEDTTVEASGWVFFTTPGEVIEGVNLFFPQ